MICVATVPPQGVWWHKLAVSVHANMLGGVVAVPVQMAVAADTDGENAAAMTTSCA
jgi:hypothetical protein